MQLENRMSAIGINNNLEERMNTVGREKGVLFK
jgi:hypothetical protein